MLCPLGYYGPECLLKICLNIKLKSICHSVVYDDFKLFSPSDRQCWYKLTFKPDLSDSTDARFFSLSFGSLLRLHAYRQGICVCCMLKRANNWRVLSAHILVILIALHYLTCIKSKRLKVKGFGLSEDSQQQKWQSFDKFKFNLKGHKHRLFFFSVLSLQ